MSSIDFNSKISKSQISINPYIYNNTSISVINIRYLILLAIQVLMLFITKSYSALIVIAFSTLGAVLAQGICFFLTKEKLYNAMSIIIQGLMIGMLVPQTYPPLTVFIISFSIIFVSRYFIFKGINSWVNIVAICVIVAWVIGKSFFPGFMLNHEILKMKNPSYFLIQSGTFEIEKFDIIITDFLNKKFFNLFKVTIPTGYISLLWDTHSVIPAFRFNLITIISSVFLFAETSSYGIVPSLFVAVYAVLVRLFAPLFVGGNFNQGDIILALLTSGTLFCAVFVIQCFGTVPITILGKIIYGIICGGTAFFISGCGTSSIGMVYTILLCNIINMLIMFVEEKTNLRGTESLISRTIKVVVDSSNDMVSGDK